ncbi:hypothetical protein GCM10007901_25340 [Dyella acidisoli]|uniref:Uncharacterized protein n=1 Tax=Dyella acidisoli TaxID=1867834 RepID=A0ABQ5XT06_9GAMM|nr:hypothetical protein GCM10007901_25340 [Dyella acidisoli]
MSESGLENPRVTLANSLLLATLAKLLEKDIHMEIDNSWLPTLLCTLNDGIKYTYEEGCHEGCFGEFCSKRRGAIGGVISSWH